MASPIIIYILLQLFTGKPVNSNEKNRTTYLILTGIVMTLMIGLRHPTNGSGDTQFYYDLWEAFNRTSFSNLVSYIKSIDMELGFQIICWILSKIFHNGQWCFFLSGLFFSFSVCLFAKKNCKNLVLALTVFNCLGLFNFMVQGLRQSIAMCICLFALEFCKDKKPVKFLLIVAFAMTFHASAVVFVIMYIIKNLKLDFKSYFVVAIATIAIVSLLPRLFLIVNYFINDTYEAGNIIEGGGTIAILINIVILAFGLFFNDKSEKDYALFVYMTIISTAALIMRNYISTIVERVAYYFSFGQIVVISNSITSFKDKKIGVLILVVVICLCLGVAVHKASYSSLIPYMFFWQ